MAKNGINKATVMGRLGQDPEMRFLPNGDAVATLSICTSETWKDKQSGEQKESQEWHRVVLWRKLAEIAGEYCRKGKRVHIEGKLTTRKWTDQNGVERYTTEIVGEDMQIIDWPDKAENAAAAPEQARAAPVHKVPAGADFEDDIPFACLGKEHMV